MTTKAKMFLAKLLIFFSIALIFLGLYLQFSETNVLDPKKDVTIIAGADDNISVTPVDKDNVNPSDDNGGEVGGESSVLPSPNPAASPSVSPSPSIAPSPNPETSPSPSVAPSSEPVVQPSTIDEKNLQLRSSIENAYGIKVKFGDEIAGYSVGGMTTSMLSDAEAAHTALTNLNNALVLYPKGFFKEISDKGYPLTIYLLKRYSTANVTGVTDSTYNSVVISIATDYPFEDTFHHEVYHYMERYIFSRGFRFTSWSTLNPSGFTYGTVAANYSYSRTYSEDAFFVNNYAQTDEYEDRASTFEYMMMSSKASCFNYGKTVWLKAKTMCEQIDYFLNSVNPNTTEYWERHIY